MKKKRILPLLVTALLVSVLGLVLTPRASAATYSTKAECSTLVTSISVTAPSSVTTNVPFTVSGITSASTAPPNITVTKLVSTSSVSNASPSTVTGTWTGTATNAFTVPFPDIALTPTGAAGSQVKLTLSKIEIYINGGSSPIVTCVKDSGSSGLTADKPGESLTIFSIPIAAPATAPTSTTTPPTAKSTSPTTTSNKTALATTATPASQAPAATTNNPQTTSQSQLVTITVVDSSGNPVSDVPVTVDTSPPVKTNARGVAIFENLGAGKHKVAVLGEKTQITRDINVSGGNEPVELTVQLPHQLISPMIVMILGAVALIAILGVVTGLLLRRHRKAKALAHHIAPGVSSVTGMSQHAPIVHAATPATTVPNADTPSPAPAVEPAPVQPSPQPLPIEPVSPVPSSPIPAAQPIAPVQPTPPPATVAPIIQPKAPAPTPNPEPVQPVTPPVSQAQPLEHLSPSVPHQPGQMIVPQAPTETHA